MDFLLPKIKVLKEYSEFKEKMKQLPGYGERYIDGFYSSRLEDKLEVDENGRYFTSDFGRNKKYLDIKSQKFYEELMASNSKDTFKAGLKDLFSQYSIELDSQWEGIPSHEIYCPYFGTLIKTIHFTHIDRRYLEEDLRYEDGSLCDNITYYQNGELWDSATYDTKWAEEMKRKGNYHLIWSKDFISLMNTEFSQSNIHVPLGNGIILREMTFEHADVEYSNGFTATKEIYFNAKGQRIIKKGKSYTLPDVEVEDLDFKIEKIKEMGIEDYVNNLENNVEYHSNKAISAIKDILSLDKSESDKMSLIEKIVREYKK